MSKSDLEAGKQDKAKKKKRYIFPIILLLLIALTVGSSYYSFKYVMESTGNTGEEAEIIIPPEEQIAFEIPKGSGTKAIAELLKSEGIIKYPFLFQLLSKFHGYDGAYRSGTHMIAKGLEYEQLMKILSSKPVSVKVTIPEGYTYNQIVDLLAKNKLIDKDEFNRVAATEKFEYKFLEGVPAGEKRLEGFLFPDTYEFELNTSPKEIIETILNNFNNKFKEEYYKKAEELGMTPYEIVILASIIEREAKYADERDVISGVFYNRLNHKDQTLRKLQSCATIQYIYLNKTGEIKEIITEEDTKIDDPYNTYMYEGLPPGPISCPGESAIKAALYPDDNDYIYFAARGDGTHQFSKTYKEHQAAMRKYGLN